MNKTCFKCLKNKPIEEFYKSKRTPSGYGTKCKECGRIYAALNRKKNIEHYREYVRAYRSANERKPHRSKPELIRKHTSAWAKKNKHKRNAQQKAFQAIKNGLILKKPCEKCGNIKAQAHHEDYSKPFEVVWYCAKHHGERHRELRKLLNE